MQRLPISSGLYGDILPSGSFAVLCQSVMRTHVGDLPLPLGAALYPRITDVGGFKIVGQAGTGGGTLIWEAGQWRRDPRTSHGIGGHIFDRNGVLHILEPAPNQTSQGYRYVADDGRLVLGDETYGDATLRISQYTTLGDLTVGQSWQGGVLAIHGSERRILQPGNTQFVRFTREGDRLAVCCTVYTPGQPSSVVLLWLTVPDLTSFPREAILPAPAEDSVNPPGVEILEWHPIDADKSGLLVKWRDRNNPHHGTHTVRLDEGYVRVKTVNTIGFNESSRRDRKVI